VSRGRRRKRPLALTARRGVIISSEKIKGKLVTEPDGYKKESLHDIYIQGKGEQRGRKPHRGTPKKTRGRGRAKADLALREIPNFVKQKVQGQRAKGVQEGEHGEKNPLQVRGNQS